MKYLCRTPALKENLSTNCCQTYNKRTKPPDLIKRIGKKLLKGKIQKAWNHISWSFSSLFLRTSFQAKNVQTIWQTPSLSVSKLELLLLREARKRCEWTFGLSHKVPSPSVLTHQHWVPDKEDGSVVSHKIPIPLLCVEFHCKASGVTNCVSWARFSSLKKYMNTQKR